MGNHLKTVPGVSPDGITCVVWQVPAYISHVDKRLNEETERVLHYLDQSTKYVFVTDIIFVSSKVASSSLLPAFSALFSYIKCCNYSVHQMDLWSYDFMAV